MPTVLSDRCPKCRKTISYTTEATELLCPYCNHRFPLMEFVSERLKMEKALEDKAKAQQELAAAEAQKAALQNRLNDTLTALEAIEGSQKAEDAKLNGIWDTLKADRQTHDAMTALLHAVRQDQQSGHDVLSRLLGEVMKGQADASGKLSAVKELAAQILRAQQSGAEAVEHMQDEILERIVKLDMKARERVSLFNDFCAWSRSMQQADVRRLQTLQASSDTLLQGQKEMTAKLNGLSDDIARANAAISEGFDELRRQRLDTLIELYHQATGLQFERDFDEAEATYRKLLATGGADAQDAEIYWRMLLCHYGVEYQEDKGKIIPIILRPDLTDPSTMQVRKDLREHIKNGKQEAYYAERLKEIDFYLQRYREVRLDPAWEFDVFISVKQKDHERFTRDSDAASELYNYFIQDSALAAKHLRVFNSRSTHLPVSEAFEPYIIAALMSAKVLIVVGSTPEYMNSQWVKNEWSRFQYLQKQDLDKTGKTDRRLFCYLTGGMQPKNLPAALNPDKQVLTEGPATGSLLREIMDRAFPSHVPPAPTPVQVETGGSKLTALIKHGNLALEDGEWDNASEYFDRALELDAECAEAYEGRYLVERRAASLERLIRKQLEDAKAPELKTCEAVEENHIHIQAAAAKYALPRYLTRSAIELEYRFDRSYPSAQAYYAAQYEKAKQTFTADKNLRRALRFARGAHKAKLEGLQSEYVGALEAHLTRARSEDEAAIARVKAAYEAHLARADAKVAELRRQAEAEQKEQQAAVKKLAILVGAVIVGLVLLLGVTMPRVFPKIGSPTLSAGITHTVGLKNDDVDVSAGGASTPTAPPKITPTATPASAPQISRNMYLRGVNYEIGSCTVGDFIAAGWQFHGSDPLNRDMVIKGYIYYNDNDSSIRVTTLASSYSFPVNLEKDGEGLDVYVIMGENSDAFYDCIVGWVRSFHTGDSYNGVVVGGAFDSQAAFWNEFEYEGNGMWEYRKNGFNIRIYVDSSTQLIDSISVSFWP